MYIIYLFFAILFMVVDYIRLSSIGFEHSFITEEVFIVLFLISSIGYLFKYRRNNFFCFEMFFLIFSFLITFFDYLVLSSVADGGLIESLFNRYDDSVRIKTLYVSVFATFIFILGSYISDWKSSKQYQWHETIILNNRLGVADLKFISKILNIITILYFVYLFATGYVSSWFRYSSSSSSYTNTQIVYLTILCLSSTITQFLQYTGQSFSSVWAFVKQVNKLFLSIIGIITFLLLISGNRNEALYVILPFLVCYSVVINNISNKQFFFIFLVGFCLMVFIGLTRQIGVGKDLGNSLSFNLFDFTRDFGYANIDSMYLIADTDRNGIKGFNMGIITLFSSVPFLGGILVSVFDIEEFSRSAVATTEGMDISYTGLGTSLVGDTYYTGGIVFTLIYFYLLGRVMSYLHNKVYKNKEINIYSFVIYTFMTSNAIYCLRSEWYTSFRYVGFSIVLLFLLSTFKKKRI